MKLNNLTKSIFKSIVLLLPISLTYGQPAAIQQSLNIIGAEEQQEKIKTIQQQGQKTTKSSKKNKKNELKVTYSDVARLAQARALFSLIIQHPFLTYTPKSVYTPVGTPIKWGGIGLVGNVFNGYPVISNQNNWGEGVGLVLPLGDSDKILGLALSVSEYGLQTGIKGSQGSNGNFTLTGSHWLTRHTMLAGGMTNLVPWGDVFNALGRGYYGALTQYWGININKTIHQISLSGGLGTGVFAPLGTYTSADTFQASSDKQPYPFANASFNFTPNFSIAGDYYSKTFAVGLGYNTYKILPLSFMIYVGNLRHTVDAPTSTFGLRIATAFSMPSLNHKA